MERDPKSKRSRRYTDTKKKKEEKSADEKIREHLNSGEMTIAKVFIADSKATLPPILHDQLISCVKRCQTEGQDKFLIALSGGSLPAFLGADGLISSFMASGVDPEWEKWYVFLADERCVDNSHKDSNYRSIREHMLTDQIPIPSSQIFPIDDSMLGNASTEEIAKAYENRLMNVLGDSGVFDCILCGFGPDGHTCSLFPGHPLLEETKRMVASIEDSPKPPPERITLTFPVLNAAKHVVFCGAGSSKAPILEAVFSKTPEEVVSAQTKGITVLMTEPAPYPCGMVKSNELVWVVDKDASDGVSALSQGTN